MYTVTFVILGLGVLAGLLKVIRLMFFVGIQNKVFMENVKKMLQAGNYDTAAKFCTIGQRQIMPRGTIAMIEGFQSGVKDPVELRNLFSKDVGDLKKYVGQPVWSEALAIVLAAGGMGLVFSQNLYVLPAFWPLAGGAAVAAVAGKIMEVMAYGAFIRMRDELAEALQAGKNSV